MITKTVECRYCKSDFTVTGNPGEKLSIPCFNCNKKNVVTFSDKGGEFVESVPVSYALEVSGLVKIYKNVKAVDNISFKVRKGEVFGFLGPNGAGKTTTIKSMLDLIHGDAGQITINGLDVRINGKEAKKLVGYLPEKVAFYDNLTALQNLLFYAEMKHASKDECKVLIEEFGLGDAVKKKVGTFSKGMVQRLGVARTLLGNPPIYILDEPTEGLDARGVVLIRNKIKELKQQGATIFVSSHILSEIQAVCDRVGIISKGVLVAQDTVAELSKKLNLKPKLTLELEKVSDAVVDAIKKISGIYDVKTIGCMIHVVCDSNISAKVIVAIVNAGGNIVNLQTQTPSLEEVFLKYTEE
ncbi:MAG: ABC transporter ATP-binding protein [Euryarchaeota archaeon]|nr:ABC transporter ATP-binding protein [Euryarchaeota archaeon]